MSTGRVSRLWLLLPAACALLWFWPVLAHGFRSDDYLSVYYYDTRHSLEPILFLLEKVPFLVVYCESVTCDDAFLLCKILSEQYGIPSDRLRLYFGGMVQWRAYCLPIAKGRLPR